MARFCSHSQSTIAAVEANSISLRASISLFHMHKMIHFKPTSLRRYKRNSHTIPFYKNGALVVWAVKIFHSHSGMFASLQVIVDLLGCDDVLFKPHRLEVVKGMLRQEICLIFAYHEPLNFCYWRQHSIYWKSSVPKPPHLSSYFAFGGILLVAPPWLHGHVRFKPCASPAENCFVKDDVFHIFGPWRGLSHVFSSQFHLKQGVKKKAVAINTPLLGLQKVGTWWSQVREEMANDATIGYLAILVAALGFGSNYIPVKK